MDGGSESEERESNIDSEQCPDECSSRRLEGGGPTMMNPISQRMMDKADFDVSTLVGTLITQPRGCPLPCSCLSSTAAAADQTRLLRTTRIYLLCPDSPGNQSSCLIASFPNECHNPFECLYSSLVSLSSSPHPSPLPNTSNWCVHHSSSTNFLGFPGIALINLVIVWKSSPQDICDHVDAY